MADMRFPVNKDHTVDEEKAQQLIDRAMEAGVTYYDTAWFYHDGESEPMMGRLLSRYPRESYCLATKMPCAIIDSLEQAKDIFAKQFERLQTDYFDFYLLHSLSGRSWKKMLELGVVDFLEQCHREGKFRWFGFSFHDEYEAFEEILRARDWDFCQIQLNYMDQNIQAGLRGHDLALGAGGPSGHHGAGEGRTAGSAPGGGAGTSARAGSRCHALFLGHALGRQFARGEGSAQRHGQHGTAGGQSEYLQPVPSSVR